MERFKRVKKRATIILIGLVLGVFFVFAASVKSSGQRYRSGNGSNTWSENKIKVTPVSVGDVFTGIKVVDLKEQNMMFCLVGHIKIFFTDGTTMAVRNNEPFNGQDLFTTYFSFTKIQYERLREKEISKWVLMFKNGTNIEDTPPTSDYLKTFTRTW